MEQKFKTINELNIKITNTSTKENLVDENCCTAITVCLNNNGDCFSSFVGAYNPEIVKLLRKVQKTYYRNLMKKLKQNNKEAAESVGKATPQAAVTEDATPTKKVKEKKVHERQTKENKEKVAKVEQNAYEPKIDK